MGHFQTWFSGEHGSSGLMVGHNGLRVFFQTWQFYGYYSTQHNILIHFNSLGIWIHRNKGESCHWFQLSKEQSDTVRFAKYRTSNWQDRIKCKGIPCEWVDCQLKHGTPKIEGEKYNTRLKFLKDCIIWCVLKYFVIYHCSYKICGWRTNWFFPPIKIHLQSSSISFHIW